ncbi:aldose epimerase family protein [Furfurilactobacillus sp. WILCCON 0119]
MNIEQQPFGTLTDGQDVTQITLTNDHGTTLRVLTLGATWQGFDVADGHGGQKNLLISYDNLHDYEATPFYVCKTVGRVAGRIGGATYAIDGTTHTSDQNENKNTLHGGKHGFSDVVWTVSDQHQDAESVAVTLTLAVDGTVDHFPGDMTVAVTYTLTNADRATWTITGTSDAVTLFNPTVHTYFNVTGHHELSSQQLFINGRHRILLNDEKVPTGAFADVTDTAYDFTKPITITEQLAKLAATTGGVEFDDAYRVNGSTDRPIATVSDPESGRALDLYSARNGLVIFTADPYAYDQPEPTPFTALAMEAQWLPDAIHHDGFGDIVLPANAPQTYEISYQFRQN